MGSDLIEERALARAVDLGLVSVTDVERARFAGGSALDALVRLGALGPEARAALVAEVAPLDPFASVAGTALVRPVGREPLAATIEESAFSPAGTLASAGPPTGARPFAAPPPTSRPSGRAARGLETLGPWTLLQELGRGSNGIVYRARRVGGGPDVALKVMPDLLSAGPEAVERFRQEVALGRRLDHPAVVRVLDAGEAGPHAWFAMELCAGETLAQRLSRGRMAPEEAARLVAVIARAIAHAHAHHVIHRDLKPANIMLEASGPRVTDFGLARDEARARSLTRAGDILGTPLYMAPEQLTGQKWIDGRIDVWALGVILFECVAGGRPFAAPDTVSLARQIVEHDAPPLRARAPGAPAALEAVVRRALARDPGERWPSADALADALEAFLRGDDHAALAPLAAPAARAAPARPRRRRGRRRALVVLAVAAGASSLALVGGHAAWRAARRAEIRRALDELEAAPPGHDQAQLAAARAAVAGDPEAEGALRALEARREAAVRARERPGDGAGARGGAAR